MALEPTKLKAQAWEGEEDHRIGILNLHKPEGEEPDNGFTRRANKSWMNFILN